MPRKNKTAIGTFLDSFADSLDALPDDAPALRDSALLTRNRSRVPADLLVDGNKIRVLIRIDNGRVVYKDHAVDPVDVDVNGPFPSEIRALTARNPHGTGTGRAGRIMTADATPGPFVARALVRYATSDDRLHFARRTPRGIEWIAVAHTSEIVRYAADTLACDTHDDDARKIVGSDRKDATKIAQEIRIRY